MGFFDEFKHKPQPNQQPPAPVQPSMGDTNYGLAALASETDELANTGEGSRNDQLNIAWYNMGSVIAGGHLTHGTARTQLNQAALQAGLPQNEIDTVLRENGGAAAGANNPRTPSETSGFHVAIEEVSTEQIGGQTNFWNTRPELQHIHDTAKAQWVAPWAALGGVLARVCTLTPWTVTLPPIIGGPASLNTTTAIVAPSGGGKGAAESAANNMFTWAGQNIPVSRIGSGEAIAHCLKHRATKAEGGGIQWNNINRNALIAMPEIDKLTGQAQRSGATIMSELRTVWSGEPIGHVTADANRKIPVEAHSYRVAITLGVQPLKAGPILEDADGGFPQRILWMPAIDTHPLDQPQQPPTPMPWALPAGIPLNDDTGGVWVDVCQQAQNEIREARRDTLQGVGDPLHGHRLLAQEKTAALLGILAGRLSVSEEDWQLAQIITDVSDRTRQGVEEELLQSRQQDAALERSAKAKTAAAETEARRDSQVGRTREAVYRAVRKRGEYTWSETRKLLSPANREHFEEAVARLEDDGFIKLEDRPPEGQSKQRTVLVFAGESVG